MKYKKIDVGPYNIHLINTNKFKTVTIKINFKRKVKKSEITKRSLLSRILLESSMNYKSSRLLEIKIEELYNLSLNSSSYISGNYSVLSLSSIFLNDKYTEKNQVKNSIEFILDILLNPNVENNKFNKDSFNFAVSSLKEELESQCDNPSFYSELRANEETDKKASFSYNAIGYLDDLLKIDEKNLYSYYKSVLKSDLVDVFIIGDIDEEEIKKIFSKKFKIKTIKKPSESHYDISNTYRKRIKTVCEKKPFGQSKLVMNLKVEELSKFEREYVMRVYNFILGGGPNSKLFKEVREKNSLCYTIGNSYSIIWGILKIRAGINKESFKKCVNLIKKELKSMEKGLFTDEDIEAAKTTYISSFESITDNPSSIINTYISKEYLDMDLIDDRMKNINKVNRDMIVSVSKKIHLDTIYLLEGDIDE